ncbi:MAG: hypothetical protein ACSHX0_10500 [Akkermansiaceae bacterium]
MKPYNILSGLPIVALLVLFFSSCKPADQNLESKSIEPKQDLELKQLPLVDTHDHESLLGLEVFVGHGTPIEVSATKTLGTPTAVEITN